MKTSFVLPLLLLGAAGHGTIALAQSPGTFSVTSNMTTPRFGHTATLLTNGKVLVAGGVREIVFGGFFLILATAELYDPSTGAFTATGNMTAPRSYHSAILLPDGRVLFAGGNITAAPGLTPSNGAEIYDPSTGTFAATGYMIGNHVCQQATLLGTGKVLIAGGTAPDPELYDPATGTSSPTGKYSSSPSDFNTRRMVRTVSTDGRQMTVEVRITPEKGPAVERLMVFGR